MEYSNNMFIRVYAIFELCCKLKCNKILINYTDYHHYATFSLDRKKYCLPLESFTIYASINHANQDTFMESMVYFFK